MRLGYIFVPPVGRSLYDRLVEQLRLAGQQVPGEDAGQSGADQPAQACQPPGTTLLSATW